MRILVGILYSIENEYDACIKAIEDQTHRDFEYFVLKGLGNKEAHDTLYRRFMEHASEFNLFMKIDADMVLCKSDFFEKVVRKMEAHPEVDLLETWVHDFYTNTLIGSLNTFRNTVGWNIADENIFVDRIVEFRNRMTDTDDLAPAAWHCPDPSLFQSFHFGVHKAIKAAQFFRNDQEIMPAKEHWKNFLLTTEHFKLCGDVRLGMAVLGSETALRKRFTSEHSNYSNPELIREFEKHRDLSADQIMVNIKRLNVSTWSFLPSDWRHDVLLRIRSGARFGFINLAISGYLIRMSYYSVKKKLFPSKFLAKS